MCVCVCVCVVCLINVMFRKFVIGESADKL